MTGFTSMCINHIASPIDNARKKIEHLYTGPLDTELVESMFECSPEVLHHHHQLHHQSCYYYYCNGQKLDRLQNDL